MTVGGSIALLVLGAILAFAVEFDVQGLDITVVGYILMIGGAAGLVFAAISSSRRRVVRREPGAVVEKER